MTFAAPARVEQRAETGCGRERAVEHGAAAVESGSLRLGQAAQGITRFRRLAGCSQGERQDNRGARHGIESTPAVMVPRRSIVYATNGAA